MLLQLFDVILYTTGSAFGSTAINVLDISVIIQFLSNLNSSSISQLINGKSRDLPKLLNYFKGTTISAFNLLALSGVLPIIFVLYLRDLLAVV